MDVSSDRFSFEITKILQDIAESHFVAFDLELSGVAGRSHRTTPGKPSLQEYYMEIKEAAERYQILQVGLTTVREDVEKGQYLLKPYNFDITQLPTLHERDFKRTWSMNSGAVTFLLKNGFDFGKQMTMGIHYLSRSEEEQARKNMGEIDNIKRPDMLLKPEDDALIDHIRGSVKQWMETPPEAREEFLNIPTEERAKRVPGTLNRYQIRLTHQIVQNEFHGLKTQSMNHFVQITNPSAESLQEAKRLAKESVNREVSRAIGFRWLLEAMAGNGIDNLPPEYILPAVQHTKNNAQLESRMQQFVQDMNQKLKSRRKILVGHNCFTDLVNLHKFMMGWLPEKVEDFATSMNKVFPAIVDTKHIASFGNARWGDTSLAKVEDDLKSEAAPKIVIATNFDRYRYENIEHEAGFDSLLTANIAIKASAKMQRESTFMVEQHILPINLESTTRNFGLDDADELDSLGSEESPIVTKEPAATSQSIIVDPIMENTVSEPIEKSTAELVAIRERRPSTKNGRRFDEFAKVKQTFERTTIYDVLNDDNADQLMPGDVTQELAKEVNSGSATPNSTSASKQQRDEMIKAGELMPSWNSDFWSVFGNRLQVNGCKEGICNLQQQ